MSNNLNDNDSLKIKNNIDYIYIYKNFYNLFIRDFFIHQISSLETPTTNVFLREAGSQ